MSPATDPAAPVRRWRAVRAGVVASTALSVALLGHVAGGGAVPSTPAVLVFAATASLLSYHLAARRWSVRTLTGLVLAVQAGVHLWCSTAAPATPEATTVPDSAMLLGHLVATVATVALLRRGEEALAGLAERVVARPARRIAYAVAALVASTSSPRTRRPARRAVRSAPLPLLLLGPTATRRGPPVCV
ncbi:hypothetical protein [Mumia sp. DW29H23]|uniref:hypothetical protein n=1 Tax=Mumia sp. DW29H23 TaxID=3421241 RepID=UPI003D68BD62